MADEPTTTTATTAPATPKVTPATTKQPEPAKGDEPLGDGGKKALEAEREARKQAEADLASLRKDFEGFQSKLSEAFGVQPATGSPTDAVTQLQQRLDEMQRDTTLYRLAAQHSITDEDDLDILRSATDEAAMTKLAERLAARAESTPGTPKPDATQGGAGGTPPALNSNALEEALKAKLGIA